MYLSDSVYIIRSIVCKVKRIHKIFPIPFAEDTGGFFLFLCEMHKGAFYNMCKYHYPHPIDRTSVLVV